MQIRCKFVALLAMLASQHISAQTMPRQAFFPGDSVWRVPRNLFSEAVIGPDGSTVVFWANNGPLQVFLTPIRDRESKTLPMIIDGAAHSPPLESPADQVKASERAFAQAMEERDIEAFAGFVAAEAVFFSGKKVLHGKREVLADWAKFFTGDPAPFSWEPDQVEVLDSGNLALSTGPVRGHDGKVIARFNSIWRLESPGRWRIVFDKGQPPDPES